MINRLTVPQLNYIVFELVKIDLNAYLQQNYRAQQVDVEFLAVIPSTFDYRLISRDAITQSDSSVFVNKLKFSPERCSIRGTFGYQARLINGSFMTGWQRLKAFQDNIVKLSKESSQPNDTQRFVYACNYYDMWFQKYGSINISSWNIRGDAQQNSVLPNYSMDFIIIGDLIKAQTKDLMLASLTSVFAPGGYVDQAITDVNGILSEADPYLSIAALPYDGLQTAVNLVNDAKEFVAGISNEAQQVYQNVASIF